MRKQLNIKRSTGKKHIIFVVKCATGNLRGTPQNMRSETVKYLIDKYGR